MRIGSYDRGRGEYENGAERDERMSADEVRGGEPDAESRRITVW